MGLTTKKTAKLIRRGVPGRYLDTTGLYLVVVNRRNANWTLRFQLHHRTRWMGLGSARVFSLEQARRRALEARQKLADKIDPLAVKQAERAEAKAKQAAAEAAKSASKTFQECARDYIVAKATEWRSARHGQQWNVTLATYVFPVIGKRDVADIDKAAVLAVLEQQITERDGTTGKFWNLKSVTANRTRSRIELILSYAAARGYRDEAKPNPAAWKLLKNVLAAPAKATHHAALPYGKVPAFFATLSQREGSAARALEFTILTASRIGEVIGATWSEIDLDAAIWVVPAERMKAGKEHRVPLSEQAVALLQSLPTEERNPHLFIGSHGPAVSDDTVTTTLRRLNPNITIHGFRSSFSDWAHETTGFANHAIELSLAHAVGTEVERSYRRGNMFDKRRKLLQAWSDFCNTPQATTADVIPLQRGRS